MTTGHTTGDKRAGRRMGGRAAGQSGPPGRDPGRRPEPSAARRAGARPDQRCRSAGPGRPCGAPGRVRTARGNSGL